MNTPLPFKIYNTLTRQVEDFTLADAATRAQRGYDIGLYLCGITPYGLTHVGNARTMIVFDTFVRVLRAAGYKVRFVRNFTDIDDKIINKALAEGRSAEDVSTEFMQAFRDDMAGLNVLPADEEPLVSQTLPEITTHIQRLIDRKHAYINPNNGDVLYEVASFKDYGKLANRKLDEQQAGARVEVEQGKKHPFDFVLWKQAKPGEPSWPSPWGAGRPGWHIECSAMSCKYLHGDTETFDIHGGGMDLQFPHHECEIAQSEGAYDHKYVNHWMHVAFVNMAGEKMSKSLGNIMTVREALQKFPGEVVRLRMLGTHYRQPIDLQEELLETTKIDLFRIYKVLANALLRPNIQWSAVSPNPTFLWPGEHREDIFQSALLNDFNTPLAISQFYSLVSILSRASIDGDSFLIESSLKYLKYIVNILGVLQLDPLAVVQGEPKLISIPNVEAMVLNRSAFRSAGDFKQADDLRNHLSTHGIDVDDTPRGPFWSNREWIL